MFKKNKFVSIIALVLFVTVFGGIPAFAEKSLPGDLLYKVKIGVTEPVGGVFAFTKEEKTEWQERLIERRLEEAQKLISKNSLNATTREILENSIKSKLDQFSISVRELALKQGDSSESSDINIRLEASLKAYKSVFESLSLSPETNDNNKQEAQKIVALINESNTKVLIDHQALEDNLGTNSQNFPSPEVNIQAIAKQIAAKDLLYSVKLAYQKDKLNLSKNIQSSLDNKLAQVETLIKEGEILINSSDFTNAISKFQSAITLSNDAKLLTLSNLIKSDIEDDMGISGDDIEEEDDNSKFDEDSEDYNSSSLETLNPNSNQHKSDEGEFEDGDSEYEHD